MIDDRPESLITGKLFMNGVHSRLGTCAGLYKFNSLLKIERAAVLHTDI